MIEKVANAVIFGAPDIQNNFMISAYAGMPCTTCVKGQVGQVWELLQLDMLIDDFVLLNSNNLMLWLFLPAKANQRSGFVGL
jgi:hypothetical protein